MAANCSEFWHFDDVTTCGRLQTIEYRIPALILGVSAITVGGSLLVKRIRYANSNGSEIAGKDENQALLDDTASGVQRYDGSDLLLEVENVKKSHFDIASLAPVKLNGDSHGMLKKLNRSPVEKLRVILEFLLILVELGLQISKNFTENEFTSDDISINIALWSWLLVLTSIRVFNLNDDNPHLLNLMPNLWINNFVTYLFLWFSKVLVVRSALINHTESKAYYVADFLVVSALLFDLLTSSVGFKAPTIYVTDPKVKPAPEPYTSLLGLITFSWVNPLIWKAYKSGITIADVWDLTVDDYSYYVLKRFKASGEIHPEWTFTKRIVRFFLGYLLLQGFWAAVESCIVFIPTLLLKKLLEYVEDRSSSTASLAWCYVFGMFFCKFLSVIASGQALYLGRRVCIRLKSIVISEVYGKALRRKLSAQDKPEEDGEEKDKKDADKEESKEDGNDESKDGKETDKTSANLGAIINLMAVDAQKVSDVCAYLHAFVGATFMIFISIFLLWTLLGWSALVGAASIVACTPINFALSKSLGQYQKLMLGVTDRRIQKLNETFQSIRIIKFFAWEQRFRDQILKIRKEELSFLKKRSIVWTILVFIWFITPTVVTFVSFGCYVFIAKKPLTTPVAFTALSLFNLLRNPLDQLSDMLSFVIQSKVSLDRIQNFLNEEETTKYEQLANPNNIRNLNKIGFKDASFAWNSKSEVDFKLKDLNIDFKIRKLNVIIGPTGAGKTSLLMALLGEMEKLKGDIYLPGFTAREDLEVDSEGFTESVAYCSQAAWLLNDTIRNNIVFTARFNKDRYNKVVEACGLTRDFEILKAGDQTEIGEKGITLSGGQKQRVSLARALYSNSRHILLDDCLSAVDSHTALHIYEKCISGPLMKNRTVILVSHNVALTIKDAEFIVLMDNGKISQQGSPEELFHSGALGNDEMIKSTLSSRQNSSVDLKQKALKAEITLHNERRGTFSKPDLFDEEAEELENLKKGKLIEEETKSEGVVSKDVYKYFMKEFGGYFFVAVVLILFIFGQFVYITQSWWLRAWAKQFDNPHVSVSSLPYNHSMLPKSLYSHVLRYHYVMDQVETMKSENSSLYYIIVYCILGVSYATISSIRLLVVFFAGIRASSRIFRKTLDKVLRAKLRFFDSTPIGRIMNRFSKDMEAIDQELVPCADGVMACLVSIIFTLSLISFITPGFLLFAIVISGLYYIVGVFYLSGSRELKRFDSITKSPIHQHFSETLVGVSTIRAYGIERRFLLENLNKIDDNNKPFLYMWIENRWFSFRNDLVGTLVVLTAGAFVLMKINSIDAGLAGISLSYAITFNENALWVVRLYAEVEMTMNSVERLKEYLDLEEEPAEYIEGSEPPATWPENGKLEIHDLSLRYAPNLPKVINNVSFVVEPCNKVGIVGRTGAGKSTIITALFRFLDPETGYIKIDDVDITSIGLKTLRQAITIIPQDPTLFTGSIKSNLDPFGVYSDEQIFEALRRVNLITGEEIIQSAQGLLAAAEPSTENVNKFLNLQNEITEGGGNLSQGQRQLVCLARSLLKAPKIMLLDEATASIDYESDARIQQTIRQEFSGSTILTIAHRLRSIIDYDKILVMDAGEVIEFDHPYSLISNTSSSFHSMCKDSGELEVLIQLSKESYLKKVNAK
jgi:ABC-type multidrug transport system fused ATPase/permease subunit